MIRLRGFARKTQRTTKGGSLPDPTREICPAPQLDPHSESGSNMGNNGHHNGNGNGADTIHHSDISDRLPAPASDTLRPTADERNGNGLRSYLNHIVEELVEPRSPTERKSPLDDARHRSVDGHIGGELATIFARAAVPAASAKSIPAWKRVFDVSCIVLTLSIWLPMLLLVMGWIKLVSPGPIFYRQQRVGYRRRPFMIFKFRTMHVNAETRRHEDYFAHLMQTDCPMTKLDAMDDDRLIRCGRLLRASGLDELPQLFNVLFGHMSLVGPRPCLPNEFQRYTPAQQARVNAPPGLTGYWQVNGKNRTTFSEMIAMDIYYCEHMSLWLDLTIILKTIPALVAQTLESRTPGAKPVGTVPTAGFNGAARKS